MSVKFFTNRIPTSTKVSSLSDIVKAAQTKAALQKEASANQVTKTASTAVKEAKKKVDVVEEDDKACVEPMKGLKKTKKASSESEEGKDSGQPKAEAKLVNDPHKDPKLSDGKGGKGNASDKEEGESSGQPEAEAKLVNKPELPKKDATSSAKWIKVSNLTGKQKEFLRNFYKSVYPDSYIDALLADK